MKFYLFAIIRIILRIFWIFPICKKKIFFISFGGSKIACNPLYIYDKLKEKYPNYLLAELIRLSCKKIY